MDLQQLLQTTIDKKASDLHLVPDYYPTIRINNELYPLTTVGVLTKEASEQILLAILSEEQREDLLANKEIDFGFQFGTHRFRVNLYYGKSKLAASFRVIPGTIPSIDDLKLPAAFHEFAKFHQGFVIVAGPTGEGKTTTLASIVNEINTTTAKHILTIEDPIEYIYPVGKSIISQRELQQDTHSWNVALRSALREDPDIILVGEMRDYDTVQAALTIAETGHLVFSTLHTSTASETVNRIIDVFPATQQNQIRAQLASSLRAVVSQRLIPDIVNQSRIPACEILLNTPAVSSVIREGKIFMIDNILETGEEQGQQLFEKSLARLYQEGNISRETALNYALRTNEIKKFVI